MEMASATNNGLCEVCQALISRVSCDPGSALIHEHHLTLESLEEGSKGACGICTEVTRSLEDDFASGPADALEFFFPMLCVCDTSSASWQSSFEMTFKLMRETNFSVRFVLEVVEDSESSLVKYTPSSSTDSPQSWDLIGRWLNQCTQNHGRCNMAALDSWVPTRLLDIGTSEDSLIRLLDYDETHLVSNQPYATLSHCWGTTRPISTNRQTIQRHKHGISYHEFPPTFKDAIRIARNVHIRYLWIDSLCIIQDSVDDWRHEADLMSKVYRYSFINIAATGSENSLRGCFWERNERMILPLDIYIQWSNRRCDHNEEGARLKYRVVLDADIWTRKLTEEPLNRRCWILQERILSPRVLHFGSKQLFWECREFVACETYHLGLPVSLQSHPLINIKRLQLGHEPEDNRWPTKYISEASKDASYVRKLWDQFTSTFQRPVIQEVTLYAGLNSALVYQNWYAVVELYSMGNLTFPDDKLVALSGIAQTISTLVTGQLGDGYLAGLWQSSLPASLLWQPKQAEISIQPYHNNAMTSPYRYLDRGLTRYIAPTWSWASIDGQISFTSCQVNYKSEDYLAVLEDASVSYCGNYRFGQTTSGFIKLCGPIASVLWETSNQTLSMDTPTPYVYNRQKMRKITHIFPPHLNRHASVELDPTGSAGSANIQEILFDTVMEDMPEELTLLCVVETKECNGHIDMIRGLILQRSSQRDDYVRIGIFVARRERLRRILVNMPRRSVTIV